MVRRDVLNHFFEPQQGFLFILLIGSFVRNQFVEVEEGDKLVLIVNAELTIPTFQDASRGNFLLQRLG